MSKKKKQDIESLGYTESQLKALKSTKSSESVQISGVTTSVKRTNVRKLIEDLEDPQSSLFGV